MKKKLSAKSPSAKLSLTIIFVRRFQRSLRFYQKVFNLKMLRLYKEKKHPRWAEFQLGDMRLALHAGYRGRPYRGRNPLAIHFRVKNIDRTVEKIKRYGGKVVVPPRRCDFRPAELTIAYEGVFADPDGNEFDFQELIREF